MAIKYIAVIIFLIIYAIIMTERVHRTIIALWGAVLFTAIPLITPQGIQLGLLTPNDLVKYVNWEALGLIFGLFTLVAALRDSGFFRWLGLTILKATKFDPFNIFILFSLTAAFLAAFMDSITVLMFMSVLTLETCGVLKINPVPFIIAEITSANIGGSATMVGDPPNIIIGTSLHFSFMDFVSNVSLISITAFIVNCLFLGFIFRKMFANRREIAALALSENQKIEPSTAITDLRLMIISSVIFALAIAFLVFHHILGLSVALIGVTAASFVLLLGGDKMPEVLERIDWHTLIFFTCLFIMVGGLEKTGALEDMAHVIGRLSGGNVTIAVMIILWMSAVLSAIIDNVPFAAAMVPIVRNLSTSSSLPLGMLAWALALGTDIGGNATPIGASANIVGISAYEKRSGKKISWSEYCRAAIPATILSVSVCSILLYLKIIL